ncbi:hypothetical protein HN51_008767 [Arachis hypogaea]
MYVFNCVTEHESVVSVFESKLNRLHTTHSWNFLGLNSTYTSLSFVPSPPQPIYFEDAVSVATACNVAPWILTVAASTLDIHLENSKVLKGLSLNPIKMDNWHALIYASAAAAPGVSATNASLYKNNTLDRSLIKDKIVICTIEKVTENRRLKAMVIKEGGGVGMILIDHNTRDVGFEFVIPATLIGQDALEDLQSYINTERNPIARIHPTRTVLDTKPVPEVAAFSSMGPNVVTPDIIKTNLLKCVFQSASIFVLSLLKSVSNYSLTSQYLG